MNLFIVGTFLIFAFIVYRSLYHLLELKQFIGTRLLLVNTRTLREDKKKLVLLIHINNPESLFL